MRRSCQMIAKYDRPLSRITQPDARAPPPSTPISRPARAGPISRATLNAAALSPTALVRSSGPTISETKDWRVGASKADAMPNVNASE